MEALIIPAFIAGLLTFLAPCTLPLVPAYLAFISGTVSGKRCVFQNAVFFVLGFSAVFISFGLFAGLIGGLLFEFRIWVSRIGGLFVVLFGLFMLGALNIPFFSAEKKLFIRSPFAKGAYLNSLLLGIIFGAGWTPCVGPVLGSVLFLASQSATAASGALLLAVFSLGLAVPFLLIAASLESAERHIQKFSKYLRFVNIIGGIFLIILGALLLFGQMGLLSAYGFKLFGFFNYDSLLNYL
ncbi:MAG: sulfite exporter TauE/SafE family protein [Parcubacteria group bacterium]|nr:sulfite exporter TauE/SafE family protein [Parcubacteria group bacterium]